MNEKYDVIMKNSLEICNLGMKYWQQNNDTYLAKQYFRQAIDTLLSGCASFSGAKKAHALKRVQDIQNVIRQIDANK